MIEVTAYKAESGTVFEHKVDAVACDARHDLFKVLADAGVGSGGEWTRTMFFDFLMEHAKELRTLLSRVIK